MATPALTRRSFLFGATAARLNGASYRIWPSLPPAGCPFEPSNEITGLAFTGESAAYTQADTFYPSWASDGNLYTPWTDGRLAEPWNGPRTGPNGCASGRGEKAHTGNARIEGDDPRRLRVVTLGTVPGPATPYGGRYPCGSLVHNGIWYYGTYCLGPSGNAILEDGREYNWPWLGPFVGFRISRDYGKTWTESPHTPEKPLFGEHSLYGQPVKIGSPHFVDFGRNMEHSPDGLAYLVAHGATAPDPKPRFANASWISGDQVFLLRVKPAPDTINDASAYEFFAGHDGGGAPLWSRDFKAIRPLIDWNNNCGCATATFIPPLQRYILCVTDGWPTVEAMNTYLLEAERLTGPWRLITYMKDFGVQAYFVNVPSKFIGAGGRRIWLCYSGNFTAKYRLDPAMYNPPHAGQIHAMTLQEALLLDRTRYAQGALRG